MTPRELAAHLQLEAKALAAYGADDHVLQAQAERLGLLANSAAALQTDLPPNTPRVHLEDMQAATPVPKNVIANTKSEAPALRAVLSAGWSVRQLAEKMNENGLKISHSYLGRMLKGTATPSAEVKRAVRELTKVKI